MENFKTIDVLFLKFRSTFIKLDDVAKEFYSHLSKEKVLEKARQQKFPFPCFRLDESQKGPLFVKIGDLAEALDEAYLKNYHVFKSAALKATHSTF
jgi:hypothetical protein